MRVNDVHLSANLALYELECKCGCGKVIAYQKLVSSFQKLRDLVKKPLVVNSGTRCPARNKKVKGSPNSQHLLGKAVDIALPSGLTVDQFAELGKQAGFTGIGKYKWGCHFDIRDIPTSFDMR